MVYIPASVGNLSTRIPQALRDRTQWLAWAFEPRSSGKPGKVPVCPATGRRADVTRRSSCGTLADAVARCGRDGLAGVGFALFEDDGLTAIDLDDCHDPDVGESTADANRIVNAFQSYTELSPSKRGLHVFVEGKLPVAGKRCCKIELYAWDRFLTVTGDRLPNTSSEVESRPDAVADLYRRLMATTDLPSKPATIQTAAVAASTLDDENLLALARRAKNGAKLISLFDRGEASNYPSLSEADLALCQLLAFWSGPDHARLDGLYRQSALFRPKWDQRRGGMTYGNKTLGVALQSRSIYYSVPFYSPPKVPPKDPPLCMYGGKKTTSQGGNRRESRSSLLGGTQWEAEAVLTMTQLKSLPLPALAGHHGDGLSRLSAFCQRLQAQSAVGSFFLSNEMASRLLDVPRRTAGHYLQVLRDRGLLFLVKAGCRKSGLASEYRYVAESL